MNRLMICWILATPAGLALAGEADDDWKRFEGTWRFASLEADGQAAPAGTIKDWRWMVQGKEIIWIDPIVGASRTSILLDPAATPRAIDMTALDGKEKGKRVKGIYEFQGDRLTICLSGGRRDGTGPPRPDGFGGGKGMSLMVLDRVKAK